MLRRVRRRLRPNPDRFLRRARGVVHVGAHVGQERYLYDAHGLRALWIEPLPHIARRLQRNIAGLPGQRALQNLVTDRDDADYPFHVANNEGGSSSILALKLATDIWPWLAYTQTLTLRSVRLASLLEREGIDPAEYDALVLDTQGSELLVLRGADPVLRHFDYVKTEVADFESYAGCCQLPDIDAFLRRRGYKEFSRATLASRPGGGRYYDLVYRRRP